MFIGRIKHSRGRGIYALGIQGNAVLCWGKTCAFGVTSTTWFSGLDHSGTNSQIARS